MSLGSDAVVKWLETIVNGAESRRKVMRSYPGFGIRRLENSLCQPSSKWVPFSKQGMIRQRKERDGLCLSLAMPMIQWAFSPTVATAIRLSGTFTFVTWADHNTQTPSVKS